MLTWNANMEYLQESLDSRPSPHLRLCEYLIQFCGFQILYFDNLEVLVHGNQTWAERVTNPWSWLYNWSQQWIAKRQVQVFELKSAAVSNVRCRLVQGGLYCSWCPSYIGLWALNVCVMKFDYRFPAGNSGHKTCMHLRLQQTMQEAVSPAMCDDQNASIKFKCPISCWFI